MYFIYRIELKHIFRICYKWAFVSFDQLLPGLAQKSAQLVLSGQTVSTTTKIDHVITCKDQKTRTFTVTVAKWAIFKTWIWHINDPHLYITNLFNVFKKNFEERL